MIVENIGYSIQHKGEYSGGVEDWSAKYQLIFNLVRLPQGKTLDVGSADVRFARWLRDRKVNIEVVSLDVRSIRSVTETLVRGSVSSLPFIDESFDTVVSFFSVPKLIGSRVDEKISMQEMMRVSSGRVIIWPTPASWIPFYLLSAPEAEWDVRESVEELMKDVDGWSYKIVPQPEMGMKINVENNILLLARTSAC